MSRKAGKGRIGKMRVKFCPKCKSTNVEKEITTSFVFGAPQMYKCNKCGFKGYLFPEVDAELKQKDKKRKSIR